MKNSKLKKIIFLLLAIFIGITIFNIKTTIQGIEQDQESKPQSKEWMKNIVLFIVGAGAIFGGAQLMVNNATILARAIGISEKIIGVTILAVGTSLPELVTTITAIRQKNTSLGVGNIIGANLIDMTLILPICSLLSRQEIPVAKSFVRLDFPVCFCVMCIALIPTICREKTSRIQGILMLLGYIIFVVLMLI